MVKNARDHFAHRRLSLKMALRHSPRTFAQLLREPVYKKLALEGSSGEANAAIRQDLEYLRANGEDIHVWKNRQGAYEYRLDDDSNIRMDTTGLNLGLLMPLLMGKDHRLIRNFATMGMNKALASGHAEHTTSALALSIPAGDAAPIVASAVQHHRVLDIDYQSVHDHKPVRRFIVPWALEIHAGEFYVRGLKLEISDDAKGAAPDTPLQGKEPKDYSAAAHSVHAAGERLYKLSRMSRCAVTQHKIRYPIPPLHERETTFFAPVTAMIAIRKGAAPALALRGEKLAYSTAQQLLSSDSATSASICAEYLDNLSNSHSFYMLHAVDKSALLEDLAFYADTVKLVAPTELVDEMSRRTVYLAEQLDAQHKQATQLSHCRHQTSLNPSQARGSHSMHREQAGSIRPTRLDLTISRRESYYSYLLKNGSASLKDIAQHFSVTPVIAYRELKDLYTTEIFSDGYYVAPYDMEIPLWDSEADIDPYQIITAIQQPDVEEFTNREISFTLAEIIALLSAIDSLLSVASGEHQAQLIELRTRVTESTAKAGYGSALWPAPHVRCAPAIMQALVQAIEQCAIVEIEYSQMNAEGQIQLVRIAVKPFAIDPQLNPLLAAMNEQNELRTYRVDRISEVKDTGFSYPKTPVRQWKKAYKKVGSEFHGESADITITREGRWILEELPGAQLACDDGETLVVQARISNAHWLRTLLLRLGDAFIALAPAHLATQLAPDMKALEQHYRRAATHEEK